MYLETPSLVRKTIFMIVRNVKPEGSTCQYKKSADVWFDDERIAWITERYSAPDMRFFETPVVVHPDEGQLDNPGY